MKRSLLSSIPLPTLLTCAALSLASCSDSALPDQPWDSQDAQADEDFPSLGEILSGLDGVSDLEEVESETPGYRAFRFNVRQRVFHSQEDSETFTQRVMLMYKGALAPTVLVTHGYGLRTRPGIGNIAASLEANELRVEHRYFGESVPDSKDNNGLRIRESSADLHRVVKLLRPLMLGSWVSTGGSKSGMTAMFHRRFYPFDTQATVALVAPISFGLQDPRYREFMDSVGSEVCRNKILDYQKRLLSNKDALVERLQEMPEFESMSFELLPGGVAEAFERAVHEAEFATWQYFGDRFLANDCADFPAADSELEDMLLFTPFRIGMSFCSDDAVRTFAPYHVQTMLELGYPNWTSPELKDLYTVDVEDTTPFLAGAKVGRFDPGAMIDMYIWTSLTMNRSIMLYGELDPYTAAPFGVADTRIGESYVFTAPNTTHNMWIEKLDKADEVMVIDAIERWTGASWNPPLSREDNVDNVDLMDLSTPELLEELKIRGPL